MKAAGEVETVHCTKFGGSAENIQEVLQLQGCGDRVIGLPGDFSVGPIDPPDPDMRQEWFRTVLRPDPDFDLSEPEGPWIEATSGAVHPVYWVCLTNAYEHASFLAFVDRMAGRPFDIVDATGLDIATRRGVRTPPSIGAMRPEDIVASRMAGRRRPFTQAESDAARATWSRLRREDAPLRIVRDGELVSAPLTHFDAFIMAQAAPDWEKAGYLIGRTMTHLGYGIEPPGQCVSGIVLFGRILALGDAGALDVTGPGPGIRDYQVRTPAPRQAS